MGLNVLSLFDGMSCGQIALDKLGVEVDNYYASEIDKYAIKVTQANYPNTIQLGDVKDVSFFGLPQIDLLIAGSPCQGFSFAGKQLAFDDPRSMLFFEFTRLLKELNPKYFFLENVKMKKEYQDIISKYVGCEPIEINSSLVSAQNRKRLYWTNIPNIEQPEDKGILLKDILEDGCENIGAMRGRYKEGKSGETEQRLELRDDNKSNCVTTVQKDNLAIDKDGNLIVPEATKKGYTKIKPGDCFDLTFPNSKTRRGRNMKDKSNCLTASNYDFMQYVDKANKIFNVSPSGNGMNGWVYHTNAKSPTLTTNKGEVTKISDDGYYYRKLTPVECERLQTVPDNYTNLVSNSQRYKMLGNGWTVDVIAHIIKNIKL